jgi:hypothetical protein
MQRAGDDIVISSDNLAGFDHLASFYQGLYLLAKSLL